MQLSLRDASHMSKTSRQLSPNNRVRVRQSDTIVGAGSCCCFLFLFFFFFIHGLNCTTLKIHSLTDLLGIDFILDTIDSPFCSPGRSIFSCSAVAQIHSFSFVLPVKVW